MTIKRSIDETTDIRKRAIETSTQQRQDASRQRAEADFWEDLGKPPAPPPTPSRGPRLMSTSDEWRYVAIASGAVAASQLVLTGEPTMGAVSGALLLCVLTGLLHALMHLALSVEERLVISPPVIPRSVWWPLLVAATVGTTAYVRASAGDVSASLACVGPALVAFIGALLVSRAADGVSKSVSAASRSHTLAEEHTQRIWAKHERLTALDHHASRADDHGKGRANGHAETNGSASQTGTVRS